MTWILLVVAGDAQEHPHHRREDEQHPEYRLGDGEIVNREGGTVCRGRDLARNDRSAVRSRAVFSMHGVGDAIQFTCLVAVTVSFECVAHEELHSLALDVKNDRQWNMDITEEVDIMRVCNVVDDELACHKLFIVGVVAVIVMRVLVMSVIRV